eukprot:scaffold19249_cov32-Tisochrysis_lutea.AAC.2
MTIYFTIQPRHHAALTFATKQTLAKECRGPSRRNRSLAHHSSRKAIRWRSEVIRDWTAIPTIQASVLCDAPRRRAPTTRREVLNR